MRVKWSPITKVVSFNVGKNEVFPQHRVIASDMATGEYLELCDDPEWQRITEKAEKVAPSATLHRRELIAKQLRRYVEKKRHETRRALFLQSVAELRQPAA
ncbi:MAG: hypothetical protein PVF65_06020 [Sphingomonadales bacterium]|jgi:hypothetical protein